ncbi:MAG: DUF3857 and transglutaminase domain-containing protein [Candidatus Omnitrophica bacterium]|nr:DUF3857 and transglutaminase domain-containing protein [Candidatus Omnitrophota bacterium]
MSIVTVSSVFADERDKEVAMALSQAQEQKASSATWEGRNTDQPYLALLNEYETKINPDWSYEETYHTRVKVQKESAKELGEWPIFYNKAREEIVQVQAFLETPEGKRVPAAKIQDVEVYENVPLYADMKVKVISMPQVNAGNVLDVTVKTRVSRKEIPGHFWDEIPYPSIPTKFARHTYIFPEDKLIEFKAYKQDLKPLVEKKNGLVKYSFVFERIQGPEEEELMPPLDEVRGSLYLSSLKDWNAIALWYKGLIDKNTIEDEQITTKALELARDKAAQKDRARAILEFIQDQFRYVPMNFGDHMAGPHPTIDIFKDRYGDSKDLSLLARQMFKAAGIESNICLMSAEYTGNPQNALPNPSVFEHVLLEADLDGQKYFVDPQARGFDFGQYPSTYDQAYVFVVDDAGAYRFDRVPAGEGPERSLISQSDITIAPDGSANFDARMTLPLEASQGFRGEWAAASDEHKNKFFEGLETNFAPGGAMLSHEVKGVENRYGPVEFHLKYRSPNAYPVVNDMILLKEAGQSEVPDFAAPQRKHPIFLPSNSLIKNTNVYHVPEGYKVDFVPENYKLGIDFVDVSADYANGGSAVTVNTEYRMKRASMPPQRYGQVKQFRDELTKKDDQYIVLKKKSQLANEAKEWIKNQ